MKILYIITKSNFGGAQRYVLDLATHMYGARHDVVVALGGAGALMEKLHAAGVRTVAIPELARDIFFWKDFISFVKIFILMRNLK